MSDRRSSQDASLRFFDGLFNGLALSALIWALSLIVVLG